MHFVDGIDARHKAFSSEQIGRKYLSKKLGLFAIIYGGPDRFPELLIAKACFPDRSRKIIEWQHLSRHELVGFLQMLDERRLDDLHDTLILSGVAGNKIFIATAKLLYAPIGKVE